MPPQPASCPQILIIPGLYGSGPDHWQSIWERQHPEFRRVEQRDWNTPLCDDWLRTLDASIAASDDNVILVGHSLGSVTIAFWAARYKRRIAGALLVAPSDTEAMSFPGGTTGFSPIPTTRFNFPTITVASTEDPYMAYGRSQSLAQAWGSRLVTLGAHGHISVSDGFGPWPEGLAYIDALQQRSSSTAE